MVAATLASHPAANIAAAVVWLPMIDGDSEPAAAESAALVPDPRTTHFYDPNHLAGRAIAASVGAPGHIAWDMYLFYEPTTRWPPTSSPDAAPISTTWFHQLGGTGRQWAGPDRYRWSEHLAESLSEEATRRWQP